MLCWHLLKLFSVKAGLREAPLFPYLARCRLSHKLCIRNVYKWLHIKVVKMLHVFKVTFVIKNPIILKLAPSFASVYRWFLLHTRITVNVPHLICKCQTLTLENRIWMFAILQTKRSVSNLEHYSTGTDIFAPTFNACWEKKDHGVQLGCSWLAPLSPFISLLAF